MPSEAVSGDRRVRSARDARVVQRTHIALLEASAPPGNGHQIDTPGDDHAGSPPHLYGGPADRRQTSTHARTVLLEPLAGNCAYHEKRRRRLVYCTTHLRQSASSRDTRSTRETEG